MLETVFKRKCHSFNFSNKEIFVEKVVYLDTAMNHNFARMHSFQTVSLQWTTDKPFLHPANHHTSLGQRSLCHVRRGTQLSARIILTALTRTPGIHRLVDSDAWVLKYSYSYRAGVLKLFLKRAGWDSSSTWKGQNCFWRGANMCAYEHEARSPLRPGSRARSRALEVLGL